MNESEFSPLAINFSRFICRLAKDASRELSLAAKLLSQQVSEGHICVNLKDYADRHFGVEETADFVLPELSVWRKKLKQSDVIGSPGDFTPLVLDQDRLYLHRYWEYEQQVITFLTKQSEDVYDGADSSLLKGSVERYFDQISDTVDWQAIAAFAAVARRFCVVTGGPGTGKTTTVAKILAMILEQCPDVTAARIMLAAPTGKAAARLQESIIKLKKTLPCSERIRETIPDTAMTLHRLLGGKPNSPYFHYSSTNLLPADIVVVDEASMIDLPLMAKLIQAMDKQTRLILLGDRNQLASVEPGSVFADICENDLVEAFSEKFADLTAETIGTRIKGTSSYKTDLCDSVVELKKSYRFMAGSGIEVLSSAVNNGDYGIAIDVLNNDKYIDIVWRETPQIKKIGEVIGERIVGREYDFVMTDTISDAFAGFDRFMVLCALRKGHNKKKNVNKIIERIVHGESFPRSKIESPAKPIMITKNDYGTKLFNGDIGIIKPDGDDGVEYGYFAEGDTAVKIPAYRLPPHETAYAMTVHKSQGSEFDSILLILPDVDSPVLTRELIYTALTRARKRVEVWADKNVFENAVAKVIRRGSGIKDLLTY